MSEPRTQCVVRPQARRSRPPAPAAPGPPAQACACRLQKKKPRGLLQSTISSEAEARLQRKAARWRDERTVAGRTAKAVSGTCQGERILGGHLPCGLTVGDIGLSFWDTRARSVIGLTRSASLSSFGEVARKAGLDPNALLREFDLPPRCAAAYFPEANALVPLDSYAEGSRTPSFKSLEISIASSTD